MLHDAFISLCQCVLITGVTTAQTVGLILGGLGIIIIIIIIGAAFFFKFRRSWYK